MKKRISILLALALLLVLLLILVIRSREDNVPAVLELTRSDPELESPSREVVPIVPAPERPLALEGGPEEAASPSPTQAPRPVPVDGTPAAETGQVVRYGAQILVAGTVEECRVIVNGTAEDSRSPLGDFELERYVFVSEESALDKRTGAVDVVRTYTACGICFERHLGTAGTADSAGVDAETLHNDSPLPVRASPLENLKARQGPAGSIVLVGISPGAPSASGNPEEDALQISGARWDLGLSVFLPDATPRAGARWTVPAQAFTNVLFPGGDLPRPRDQDQPAELPSITPGGLPTLAQLASLVGDMLVTSEGISQVRPDRQAARISIDLDGEGEDGTLAQALRDALRMPSGGVCTAKSKYSFEGNGVLIWKPDETRPPLSEIHCIFSNEVEMHVATDQLTLDCFYRITGHLAVLGGLAARIEAPWNTVMWLPREEFLDPGSFTIRQ
ncbi:MAG TPA: hypothetical protein VK843_08395 [Planctomycetota bacterium]|nr:hypothetical protein [Planctomycetota bacterium]